MEGHTRNADVPKRVTSMELYSFALTNSDNGDIGTKFIGALRHKNIFSFACSSGE